MRKRQAVFEHKEVRVRQASPIRHLFDETKEIKVRCMFAIALLGMQIVKELD